MKSPVFAATLALFLFPAAAAADPTECDRLAAGPYDPDRVAERVLFDAIDGPAAEKACRAAIADSGNTPRFVYQLGRALDRQDKFAEAKAAYKAAFEAGYAPGFQAFGKLLELGLGGDIDYAAAAEYYQRALDAGLKLAAGDLAYLHEQGLGYPKDAGAAAPLYKIAAEAGDAWSQVHLGFLYETGSGVDVDYREAVKWYRAAADQGDAMGQFDLGVMFENGKGVEKDTHQAFRLYRLAGVQNNVSALRQMARFYQYAIAVDRDAAEAERLLKQAIGIAEGEGLWQSQGQLAWLWAMERKNLEEAETMAASAAEKAPRDHVDYPAVLDTAAWIAHLRGNDEEALKRQTQAIGIEADFPPYYDRLGDIYAALGRKAEAVAAWQRALALPPPDERREPDWNRDAVAAKLRAN